MGKMKKKGSSGAAVSHISRGRAIRKLQLSLKDFRRLCILKGIYPVEPKHKKKTNRGNSTNKTYYLLKDIQYLSHEPIIWKFWDFKIFMRRVTRAKGRRDYDALKNIRENKPFYKIDHIVRERYPTFIDAVRDLDDPLSMAFLYAMFPKSKGLPLELIELCRRLTIEFMQYIIETKSLRKVFISIKGYYYQADIIGQTVVWIVPHQFVFDRITDVDFNVMRTFTEFYITLIGFVNYKLFSSSNLYYPPKSSYELKSKADDLEESDSYDDNDHISALNKPLLALNNEHITEPDDFDERKDTTDDKQLTFHEMTKFQNLFKGLVFFLNREVPHESLVFVIRSFSGVVSWDKNLYSGAVYDESDQRITHQIIDRDTINTKVLNRYYIQPQWVYDSVNARMLLPVEQYFMGEVLPAHLSPFVEEKVGDYIPPEKEALLKLTREKDTNVNEDDIDVNDTNVHQNQDIADDETLEKPSSVRPGKRENDDRDKISKNETAEDKRLAVMMIPKKKKHLYNKIMYGKRRKVRESQKLKEKREDYERKRIKLSKN